MLFPFMAHRVCGCGLCQGKAVSTLCFILRCCYPWASCSSHSHPDSSLPSTHLFSSAKEMLQIGYCMIYFLFCSIVNPINLELKQTIWIGKGLRALPSPPEMGSFPAKEPTRGSATLPLILLLASLNFHVIKTS